MIISVQLLQSVTTNPCNSKVWHLISLSSNAILFADTGASFSHNLLDTYIDVYECFFLKRIWQP